jgi:16S rRNA (uracil1498-N3)-methyltransferase
LLIMRRFFIRSSQIDNDRITLTGSEAHHLATVLRLRAGAEVEFCDGTGVIHVARLEKVGRTVRARVLAARQEKDTSPLPLILAQCVLKGKKMDMVVQKATELGVQELIPVQSRYSMTTGGDAARQMARMARWQRIVQAACKQCGRARPMRIMPATTLPDLLSRPFAYRLCCLETEKELLLRPDFFPAPGQVLLLIGPEGGFHQKEVRQLAASGFTAITLGPLILRAETAAIVGCGLVRHLGALATNTFGGEKSVTAPPEES